MKSACLLIAIVYGSLQSNSVFSRGKAKEDAKEAEHPLFKDISAHYSSSDERVTAERLFGYTVG